MRSDSWEAREWVKRLTDATNALYAWIEAPAILATDEAFDRIKAEFDEALAGVRRTIRGSRMADGDDARYYDAPIVRSELAGTSHDGRKTNRDDQPWDR